MHSFNLLSIPVVTPMQPALLVLNLTKGYRFSTKARYKGAAAAGRTRHLHQIQLANSDKFHMIYQSRIELYLHFQIKSSAVTPQTFGLI